MPYSLREKYLINDLLLKIILVLLLCLCATSVVAEEESKPDKSQWLFNTLKDSFVVTDGDVLQFNHNIGDVRINTADTDRIQITAIAQYHANDPRVPKINFITKKSEGSLKEHQLTVDFLHLEIMEHQNWSKRRIDVGIIVPKGLKLQIKTSKGMIETKHIEALYDLKSNSGQIIYEGSGNLKAHSERGTVFVKLKKTTAAHSVELSTLTGDIRCVMREGANANVNLKTRGPITTDYSIKIDRKIGSPLKKGHLQIGHSGSNISLDSHSGGIRIQVINVHEKIEEKN